MKRMKMSTMCRVLGVGCASMLLTVACGSNASTTGADLVTPDQAKAVLLSMVTLPSTAELVKRETGSLRAIDQASVSMSPPQSPDSSGGQTHNVTVWVAHQSSYPLSFLGYDHPAKPGATYAPILYFLTKATQSAPWVVDYFMVINSTPDVAVSSDGYAQVIPESRYGALLAAPNQLAKDYAAYRTAANSADAHEFAPGSSTTDLIDGDNKNVRQAEQQGGVTVSFAFAPTTDPVAAYLMKDGSALVLFGIRETVHVVAGKNPIVVSTDGKGINGPPPGKYHDTDQDVLQLFGVLDPPKTGTDKVSVQGFWAGSVRASGTKA